MRVAERRGGPGVKICGLTRPEDAALVAAAGAAYGGVILAPGGKRSISAARAAELFEGLALRRVGVFVDAPVEELVRAAADAGLDVVQLHGDETPAYVRELRGRGGWEVWKAVRPRNASEFTEYVQQYADLVDGLLVDGWSESARGGTGARFAWAEVAPYRDLVPPHVALIVAGGLDADNLARAVELLRPTLVDVSSGVERAPGIKDPARIRAFVDGAAVLSEPTDTPSHD